MKSNGDVKESSVHSFHGTASTNHDEAGHTTAMLASSRPPEGSSSEFGRINNGDAVLPSAFIDSDLTMETSQKFRRKDNHCIQSSSPPSKSKAAVVAKNATLPKTFFHSEQHIFFQSFLPWSMVSSKKLFHTLTISNQLLLYHDLICIVVTGSASQAHLRS